MSSSFPTARFPALPLGKQREAAAEPIYKDIPAPSQELSDDELITRIAAHDQEALAILFRRYARLVWSVAERIVRNKAEADDLLQDVFLLIQRRAYVFDSSKGTARSLIVHMTYQRALSQRKYVNTRHLQASQETQDSAANIPAPAGHFYDESLEAHFGREGLREALENLSEVQRKTLRMFFFEGYSFDEIGECLGQSAGNVKHHYYRGLDRLRKHLPKK